MRRNYSLGFLKLFALIFLLYFFRNYIELIIVPLLIIVFVVLCLYLRERNEKKKYLDSGIEDIDKMSGEEFEVFLKHYFQDLGFKANLTSKTNDYGADLILKKDGSLIVVQAKRYSKAVGVRAVQEIVGAINYYGASKGIVITNNYFSSNAVNLAEISGIELWDRDKLINRLSQKTRRYKIIKELWYNWL